MKSKLIMTGVMLESLIAGASNVTKEDIKRQLEVISDSLMPKKLAMGAMCYKPMSLPTRIEYICPVCKTKTIYNRRTAPHVGFNTGIDKIRKQVKELNDLGLKCKVDESDFCTTCSNGKKFDKKNPKALYWIITIDGRDIRNKMEYLDYILLVAFLKKDLKIKMINGREEPIKKYLPRLHQLLGIDSKKEVKGNK